ncbi:MAG: hypothetical protein PHQ23_10355 [Candidatus Wallbacteria bacterium]|nr:hypothetical protein [Candidatus Wallbacteria bacterium]
MSNCPDIPHLVQLKPGLRPEVRIALDAEFAPALPLLLEKGFNTRLVAQGRSALPLHRLLEREKFAAFFTPQARGFLSLDHSYVLYHMEIRGDTVLVASTIELIMNCCYLVDLHAGRVRIVTQAETKRIRAAVKERFLNRRGFRKL